MTKDTNRVPVCDTEFLCEILFDQRSKLTSLQHFWTLRRNRSSYWGFAIGGLSNTPIAGAIGLFFPSGTNNPIAT